MKEGGFIGPEIGKIIAESQFEDLLCSTEKAMWLAFMSIATNFHGNNKSPDYVNVVQKRNSALGLMGCNSRFIPSRFISSASFPRTYVPVMNMATIFIRAS